MQIFEGVLSDRGSKYAVSGGPVEGRAGALAFVARLRCLRRFTKANHHSWAVLLSHSGGAPEPVKADDGEAGAGAIILRQLQAEGLIDHVVVVSRWYGGVKLGGDRFRHVQQATQLYLARREKLP